MLEEGSVFARCLDLISDKNETERILDELLNNQRFLQARQYAKLVGISSDKISIRQVKYTKEHTFALIASQTLLLSSLIKYTC